MVEIVWQKVSSFPRRKCSVDRLVINSTTTILSQYSVELREKVVNYFIASIGKGERSELGFDEGHPLRMQVERMVGLKKTN